MIYCPLHQATDVAILSKHEDTAGSRAYKKGQSETFISNNRRWVPRLRKDITKQLADLSADMAQSQQALDAARQRLQTLQAAESSTGQVTALCTTVTIQ